MGPIHLNQEMFPHAQSQEPVFTLTKLRQREKRWGLKKRYSEEPGTGEPEEETGQMEGNRGGSVQCRGRKDAVSTETQTSPQAPT